jgi:lysozyme
VTERYPITGIDVSDYQPRVDWTQVARAGHKFAYIKSTEGSGWEAKHFRRHFDAARNAGLLVGAYHFARWDGGNADPILDARDEALRFRDFVGDRTGPGTLPQCLDLEWITGKKATPQHMARWALAFLETCDLLFERGSIIYIGPSFWRYCVLPGGAEAKAIASWPLWEVDYNSTTGEPKALEGKLDWFELHDNPGEWTFWQHTGKGRCPGVTKPDGSLADCDLNRFNGTLAQLRSLARLDSLGSQASETA